ncbi:MAG: response regulator [Polyangiaceae bacterium]|nr:response regulator [Polyangiaceae bacterium]
MRGDAPRAASKAARPDRTGELEQENEILRQEVRVAREAANLTASAVVQQFAETERILGRLQAVSAQREAVLDAASQVAVIAADRDGTVHLFNTGAERLLGYRAREVVGRMACHGFHLASELESRARVLAGELRRPVAPEEVLLVCAENGRAEVRDWTLVCKDGRRVPVDHSVTPLRGPSGEVTGFLSVALDLTARKQAESEIREAMEATAAANRTKSAFLANMSHELRTPLNAIIGYSEMLMEEAEDEGHASFVADLKKIRSAGEHLLGLVNDILDISKIESGKIELYLEDVEVAELCAEVERMVQPLVEKNGNTLVVACTGVGTMRADMLRVRQILFNLLSNALKFTERGSVRLDVTVEPGERHDVVAFRVSDSGIGMSAEQIGRLFQPFAQADASTTRKFGGTGLGLAITKQFAELMGGRVETESELGRGTTFTVRLPRVVAPAPTARPQGAPLAPLAPPAGVAAAAAPAVTRPRTAPSTTRGKVLVVDDDPAVRELLVRYLERDGFAVVEAANGDEGLAKARAEHPDIVTLDVQMPGKDGWTVLSMLKADPATTDIPVVMLTIVEQRNAGFALGAFEYLVKPVDRTRLLQVVNRCRTSRTPRPTGLVVEDDPEARALLCQMLAREGFQVAEAENGQVGLERVAEQIPDVILLDLMMPVLDGLAFLERLRANPAWSAVPVVVVTAMDLSEAERVRLTGHVEKVVQKGAYARQQLLEEVRALLETALARHPRSTG